MRTWGEDGRLRDPERGSEEPTSCPLVTLDLRLLASTTVRQPVSVIYPSLWPFVMAALADECKASALVNPKATCTAQRGLPPAQRQTRRPQREHVCTHIHRAAVSAGRALGGQIGWRAPWCPHPPGHTPGSIHGWAGWAATWAAGALFTECLPWPERCHLLSEGARAILTSTFNR